MTSPVDTERHGAVLVVCINRPERGNALDGQVTTELCLALGQAASDPELRGIVLTGAGRLFCVGGDINTLEQWGELSLVDRAARYRESQAVITALQACPVPVVAALNGSAAGAGVDLALACDLRVAVSGASLTAAFAAVGLVPDLGGSWHLARRVGRLKALRFLLGRRRLHAEEALDAGLLDYVLGEGEDLLEVAFGVIAELTDTAPAPVVAETLRALRGAEQHDLETSMDLAAHAQARLMSTPEHQERIAAFLATAR